jgi:uncharacterized membrane protein
LGCVVAVGVYLRCAGLGEKIYWHDEAYTSLRASGHNAEETIAVVFDGREKTVVGLQEYQRDNDDRTVSDTVLSLASEDSEHPPLYFVLTRFWMRGFGSSPAQVRSLSALFGILALPAFYWLARELFPGKTAAGLGLALFSLSPFHLLFAQEARQYSLWTLITLLSSAALLRAMRGATSWVVYALSVVAGLYTHLFFTLVLASHVVFMATTEGFRLTPRWSRFLGAIVFGLLAFSPWIVIVASDLSRINSANDWASVQADWSYMVKTWMMHFASPFVDTGSGGRRHSYVRVLALALLGYSLYRLVREGPRLGAAFALSTIAVPAIALALPDLVLGGVRSATGRFLVPCHIGSGLAVSGLLSSRVAGPGRLWSTRIWRGVALALLFAGAWSCLLISRSEAWWNKDTNRVNARVVATINQADRPLVILSDPYPTNLGDLLAFTHLLDSKVVFQPITGSLVPELGGGFSDVFVFNPPEALIRELRQGRYEIEEDESRVLWRVSVPSRWRAPPGTRE